MQRDSEDRTNWVFGYGSLMWRPGFAHEQAVVADLNGLHRSLCVYSHVHRGTPDAPGLVMGLDRGGRCRGMAFRVSEGDWPETLAYLRAREQVTMVYAERFCQLRLENGEQVRALTYVVDRKHPQYAGRLPVETQVHHVRQGHGQSGPNAEYVLNTLAHMEELGVRDKFLEAVAAALG